MRELCLKDGWKIEGLARSQAFTETTKSVSSWVVVYQYAIV